LLARFPAKSPLENRRDAGSRFCTGEKQPSTVRVVGRPHRMGGSVSMMARSTLPMETVVIEPALVTLRKLNTLAAGPSTPAAPRARP